MMQRSADDRVLMGVCGGLARGLGAHPGALRWAFFIAALASGLGVVLYLLLTLLMRPPELEQASLVERLRVNSAALLSIGGRSVEVAGAALEQWRARRMSGEPALQLRAFLGAAATLGGLLIFLSSLGL